MTKHELVIDANILGNVCRNDCTAEEVLQLAVKHRICITKEINNEYLPLLSCYMNKGSNKSVFLKEWYTMTCRSCAKKIKDDGKTPNCLSRMKRSDFKQDDAKYVRVALKTSSNILIAQEHHFQMAKDCIEGIGVRLLNQLEAIEFLK